jgi:hypothetical protein
MTRLELFDPQDIAPEAPRGPVGGCAAYPAETEDGNPVVGHISSSR